MAITLDGTNGISTPDVEPTGSTVPTNGVYLPAANSVGIATNSTNAVYINSSQNVGIGTSSPRAKLSVTNGTENTSGDAPQEAIITGANQTITSGLGILTVQSNTAIGADVGATIALGGRIRNTGLTTDASNFAVLKGAKENATSDNSAGYFAIATKPNGVAPVERMRIDSSGNVGIGTQPSYKLDVVSGGTRVAQFVNGTNTSGYSSIFSSIQSNGNNTSTYHFQGNTSGVGNWYLWGNGTTTFSSDRRLKKNIESTRDGYLEDLARLRVVKYNWKNDADGTPKELGLIAQDVEEVFAGLVQDDIGQISDEDTTIYKQLKVSVLPFMLLKAIQELKAINDTQAETIASLTARIEALEQQP